MNGAKYILTAAILIALAFVFSCSDGFNGDVGKNGLDGANGANGTNCVIEVTSGADIAKGNFKIVCGNTVVGYLNNGVNGTPGANGAPGVGGSDGTNGADCAVEAMESGNYKVICGNTVMGYLNSGVNGLPGVDGTDGIDGADGEDGAKGELGPEGNDGTDGKKGTSCIMVDVGTHVEIRCGNNPAVNMSKVEWCDAVPYNPAVKFCSEGLVVYDFCDGSSYDPITYFCHDSKLYSCGNKSYNPETQFCSSDAIYSKCGSADYNPTTQFCSSDAIYSKCGGDSYNPSTQFCSGDAVYSKCGGVEYDPSTHRCYNNSKIVDRCGINPQSYDTDLYQCKPAINPDGIYIKTPVSYGGKDYEAVLIGTQIWMAENLNYDVPDNDTDVCYDNNPSNCITYGRLYNWATAMNLDPSCNSITCVNQIQSPHRGICPTGWHIPSNEDWDKLFRYADGTTGTSSPYDSPTAGKYLKATSGWNSSGNGTDNYGFSALPGGYENSGGSFSSVGISGNWWSASGFSAISASRRSMNYDNEYAVWNLIDKSSLRSLRCSQD